MDPKNAVRGALSLFIVLLIAVASTGWIWTARHQPAGQSIASRTVLTLCIVAGVVGLVALWRTSASK